MQVMILYFINKRVGPSNLGGTFCGIFVITGPLVPQRERVTLHRTDTGCAL